MQNLAHSLAHNDSPRYAVRSLFAQFALSCIVVNCLNAWPSQYPAYSRGNLRGTIPGFLQTLMQLQYQFRVHVALKLKRDSE
jgi:hypothetical protein